MTIIQTTDKHVLEWLGQGMFGQIYTITNSAGKLLHSGCHGWIGVKWKQLTGLDFKPKLSRIQKELAEILETQSDVMRRARD